MDEASSQIAWRPRFLQRLRKHVPLLHMITHLSDRIYTSNNSKILLRYNSASHSPSKLTWHSVNDPERHFEPSLLEHNF